MPPEGDGRAAHDGRRPTILVVDDHDMVRITIGSQLEALGFSCLTAATAQEARAALAHRSDIGILWTDHRLTGHETGTDLARIAAEQQPDLRVVICSGNIHDEILWPGDWVILPKPASRRDMLAALARLDAI